VDDQSFKENVEFWIKNLQLKVPDSVVLLVGTHVDKCTAAQVLEKKTHIEERVKEMLEKHKVNLEQRRKNLPDGDNPSLNNDQINQIERLIEYKLKVIWCCIAVLKYASNEMFCYDLLHFLLFLGPRIYTHRLH